MSDEDAVQIPEFPVPRCRPGARGERQGDAAGARAAGPRLRVNHAALVRTKSACNGSARCVDDIRELLRHAPGLRLAGHVGAAWMAHRYARMEPTRPDGSIQMPAAVKKPAVLSTGRLTSPAFTVATN